MKVAERAELIDRLLEGEISDADFLRLEAELSVDRAARHEFYDRLVLTTLLGAEAEVEGARFGERRPAVGARDHNVWMSVIGAVAACLLVGVGWLLWTANAPLPPTPANASGAGTEDEASGFAVLVGQAGAEWDGREPLTTGGLVPAGILRLKTGTVQLELFSGVTVVVEGYAEFSIRSPMEMAVARGKVRAQVPEPAHGFRLSTAQGEVVDLGTDFAVSVSAEQSEIHVLDGEIEWHTAAEPARRMKQGEAIRWAVDGTAQDLPANASQFVGAAELQAQLTSDLEDRIERWQRYGESLRADPRLRAWYQTRASDGRGRRLPNLSSAQSAAGEGAVVAAARSADRWGAANAALDFSPTGSRVRMSVPGDCSSLTLLCWVKINSLDRWYNSLFLTDGHDLHEPHWQIMDDGRLFFSVKKRDSWDAAKGEKDKHVFYSPSFWNSTLSGQWLMIGTVYDVKQRRVTHYLNGEVLSHEAIPEEYLVERISIGNASLCNWGLPERDEPRFAVRNLNGSMDEFLLFDSALSEMDVRQMYNQGKP